MNLSVPTELRGLENCPNCVRTPRDRLVFATFPQGTPSGAVDDLSWSSMVNQCSPGGAVDVMESKTQTNSSGDSVKTTYSEISKRKFPNVTVDLASESADPDQRLTFGAIGDIIFDHLRLKRDEFVRFQVFKEEVGKYTLKIRSVGDIDVKKSMDQDLLSTCRWETSCGRDPLGELYHWKREKRC